MSTTIRQALKKLEGAVGNLEGSIVRIESSMAGEQRDMFGAPLKKKSANTNGKGMQGALFAKRIDHVIKNVEDILKEG